MDVRKTFLAIAAMSCALAAAAMSNADFLANCLDRDFPGLKCGSEKEFADFVRRWVTEHDYSGYNPPGRYPKSEKDYYRKEALENTMAYRFWECGYTHQFKDRKIDWRLNPTPDKYREWTWQFNRHCAFRLLARDYRANGLEDTAQTWVAMMESWMDQAPCPPVGADVRRTDVCWRTIDAGIRMCQWMRQLPPFVNSPSVSDAFLTRYFSSVWEHAQFLSTRYSRNNWLIHELEGVIYVSVAYPFLKGATEWREDALRRLVEELTRQVYPDGFQVELTTGYHRICANKYYNILRFLEKAKCKVPPEFAGGILKMYGAMLKISAPDGSLPPLNDSGWSSAKDGGSVREMAARCRKLAPEREDFAWFASSRREGAPPKETSLALPYSGAVAFRSSWETNAVWGYMDCSPFGAGHQHEDKLNFLLHAYGRHMLTEGGIFAYDSSAMREYVISTRAHNTVMFDGNEQWQRDSYRFGGLDRLAEMSTNFSAAVDFAESSYALPYRNSAKCGFAHARRVIFLKAVGGLAPFFVVVDRVSARDGAEHTYEQLWHLEDCALAISNTTFRADFAGGTGLAAFCSDAAASISDRKGVDGPRRRDLQGWVGCGSGSRSRRPIPTPVVKGSFKGARRIVTLLYPHCGACPVVGLRAGDDPADRRFAVALADGREIHLNEDGAEIAPPDMPPLALARKVAASYIARNPYEKNEYALWWDWATLWWGVTKLGLADPSTGYTDFMVRLGEHFKWGWRKSEPVGYHADSHCIGQAYLDLALAGVTDKGAQTMRALEDKVAFEAPATSMTFEWPAKGQWATGLRRWKWCDTLFMAPTVFVRMSKWTGDRRYLEFADSEFRALSDFLFSEEHGFYFRDSRFFTKKSPNGMPEFWSRGNGWVFAALAQMLEFMPKDWPTRDWYVERFRRMAKSIKAAQTPDGTWHVNLLDPKDGGGAPEMSGTCLYLYGYLWGMNNGIFSFADCGAAVEKAWKAVLSEVKADGRIGRMQRPAAAPGAAGADEEAPYGVGAFLAAAIEMEKARARVVRGGQGNLR